MCLILLAHRTHPDYPVVFAANRDEFFGRPTRRADYWADAPAVLAGRDLRAGGTWMGIARDGRWAALTNLRDPAVPNGAGRSRGELVADYLRGGASATDYAAAVAARLEEYDGFNLLVADADELLYVGTRAPRPRSLGAGVYGLSNHLLDTPWPKVRQGTQELRTLVREEGDVPIEALFSILARSDPAPVDDLPDTGVGSEWERVLSSAFIVSPEYGTRASTVLLIDTHGRATLVERSFAPGPTPDGEARFEFAIEGAR